MKTPLSAQDRAKFVDALVEEIATLERFQQRLKDQLGEAGLSAVSQGLDQALVELLQQAWKRANDRFLDFKLWQPLAHDPRAFNAELNKALAKMRQVMKILYAVRAAPQRPRKNDERNQKIYKLRRQGRTFGQIGNQLKISDKVVERAFKRYEQGQKASLRVAIEFFLDLADWQQSHPPSAPKPDAAAEGTT